MLAKIAIMIELIIALWLIGAIFVKMDENVPIDKYVLIGIKNYITGLYAGKNTFGILLSTIILIISTPSIITLLFVQILIHLWLLLRVIWKLGIKNDKE